MAAKPNMNWRYSGLIAVASNNREDVLDAIADWLNNSGSTYYNGGARTPDAGSAWTAIKEVNGITEAIRLQPPATSTRKNQRIIIYGKDDISAENPTHSGSDVKTNSRMFAAHVRDVTHGSEATYQGFDNASPYSGSQWTAFAGVVVSTSVITHVEIVEGIEGISVWFRTSAANTPISAFIGGDIWDGFGGAPAETDGGRYGIITSGYSSIIYTAFHSTFTAFCGANSATAGSPKSLTYTPGGAVLVTNDLPGYPLAGWTASNSFSGGVYARLPILHGALSLWIGNLRNMYRIGSAQHGTVIEEASVPLAYFMGATAAASNNCIGFEH